MAQPENKRLSSPEIGEIIRIDPAQLIKDNPAALIVNEAQYSRIDAYFSPQQFDTVKIAKVIINSPQGERIKWGIVDGHTKTKFAGDNKGKIRPEAPDFSFDTILAKDITEDCLRNPLITLPGEQTTSHRALTMTQYLRAVVPPTVEHSEIVVDRIAAHLINGWENIVGERIARRFSALASLTLLWDPEISLATDTLLTRSLEQHGEFMAGETKEDRERIQKAMLEIASIIRSANLSIRKQEIGRAAFRMVSQGSPIIGGEKSAQDQIFGMLHLPKLEEKLTKAFSNTGEREEMRIQLGQFISESLKRSPREVQEITDVFNNSIQDEDLTLDQVIAILTAESPRTYYSQVKMDINALKLGQFYRSRKSGEISDFEASLIKQLGQKSYLLLQDLPSLTNAIENAATTAGETEILRNRLLALKQGPEIRQEQLNEYIGRIDALKEEFITLDTRDRINKKTGELREAISDINQKVNTAVRRYGIGQAVDEVYGEEESSRNRLIAYIIHENLQTEPQIKERLTILKGLDPDLSAGVIDLTDPGMTITRALERQKVREVAKQPPVTPATLSTLTAQTPRVYTPSAAVPPPPETTTKEPEAKDAAKDVTIEVLSPEEKQRRDGNERLRNMAGAYGRLLESLNLIPDQLDENTKEQVDQLLNRLGSLRFGKEEIVKIIQDNLAQE